MRLQGIVFRLLTLGAWVTYLWFRNPMLIIPASMIALVINAYNRQSDDLKPHAEPGDENHE